MHLKSICLFCALFCFACGPDGDFFQLPDAGKKIVCGSGTHESGSVCMPDPIDTPCGKGTKEINGICRPLSPEEKDVECLKDGDWQWCYQDNDEDGWGNIAIAGKHCYGSCGFLGMVRRSGDCDDKDPSVNPDSIEVCDGHDNNCNGIIDEGDPNLGNFCKLHFGSPSDETNAIGGKLECTNFYGFKRLECVTSGCMPREICGDGLDNNCDGRADESDCDPAP